LAGVTISTFSRPFDNDDGNLSTTPWKASSKL
jgi:hypothetical protein